MKIEKIYFKAIKIRAAEEQLLEGYKRREFGGTVHTCIGQELLPAMLSEMLGINNFVISNHRGHGHYIAHTNDIKSLFREFLAKVDAPSRGIGGSQHLYNKNFLSNGIQGCTAPLAVGIGISQPTIYYLGDGTFGEGVLYEALNLARLTDSKIIFVVEDNGISQSTPSQSVLMGLGISSRIRAFGIECIEIDSSRPSDMLKAIDEVTCLWLKTNCIAVVCKSYRLNSHSKGDDTRNSEILKNLPDPLKIFAKEIEIDHEKALFDAKNEISILWDEVKTESDADYLYEVASLFDAYYSANMDLDKIRVNQIIRDAIEEALSDGALFIGEDIVTKWESESNPYGGAFGVSLGLSENYQNVIGTSISEAGLVGVAAGRALATKKLSIAEIMFADFSTLIVDQLYNGVDKYKKMFGVDLKVPLIIRLPYGMGRGYGPTHSQSPFELFSNLTEVTLVSYTPFVNYSQMLKRALAMGASALVFEPKAYYGDEINEWYDLIEFDEIIKIPGVIVPSFIYRTSKTPMLKIITHGSSVKAVLQCIAKYKIDCELIIASELYSRIDYIAKFSSAKTSLIIIEEKNSSYGALFVTIAASLASADNIGEVFQNAAVINIPANSGWENDLMITSEVVYKIIQEALL